MKEKIIQEYPEMPESYLDYINRRGFSFRLLFFQLCTRSVLFGINIQNSTHFLRCFLYIFFWNIRGNEVQGDCLPCPLRNTHKRRNKRKLRGRNRKKQGNCCFCMPITQVKNQKNHCKAKKHKARRTVFLITVFCLYINRRESRQRNMSCCFRQTMRQ